jgi:two-component system sensor histidine kinase RegB
VYSSPLADGGPGAREPGGRAHVGLPLLVRLRWGTIGFELGAVGVARVLGGMELPVGPVVACVTVTAATNVLLARQSGGSGMSLNALSGLALSLDVVLFTVILQVTGGPWNPFSILYLVYITLAAVALGAAWTWTLASLAVVCFGALFLLAGWPAEHAAHAGPAVQLHLRGMWVAFAVAAALTAYFVVKLSAAIERRDAEIAVARERVARSERLASLTTLAAGAAHELGTPLATIAVAASELERAVARLPEVHASALGADARLIRAELARCRGILDRMSVEAGEPAGEAPVRVACGALVQDVLAGLPQRDAVRIEVAPAPACEVTVPRRALVQAITSLVRNALDATAAGGRVSLAVEAGSGMRVTVRDDGPGMAPDVLAHAGEPFFSTKPAGRGLGLGLFLSRALAERLGGRLVLRSAPGAGATVAIELPPSVLARPLEHA